MEIASLFETGLHSLGIEVAPDVVSGLSWYCRQLQRWNQRYNLVARKTSVTDLVEKHFLDSLTLVPLLRAHGPEDAILIDVGSGAGFPGLVLATALPRLRVILLEPRLKRAAFLRHVARGLQLTVDIRCCRLHEASDLPRPAFVTGRAVAVPEKFLQMVRPLLALSSLVFLMGGGRDNRPLLQAVEGAALSPVACREFCLPFSGCCRQVVLAGRAGRAG